MDTRKHVRVVKAVRRMRTLAEKRAIVEETLAPGTSEATAARRHPGLLITAERLAQPGESGEPTSSGRMNETVTTILKIAVPSAIHASAAHVDTINDPRLPTDLIHRMSNAGAQ